MPLAAAELARLSRLLDAALPLDKAARAAFLAALPPAEQDLRAMLAHLLDQADEDELDSHSLAPPSRAPEARDPLAVLARLPALADAAARERLRPAQRQVGPYALLRRLGQGGMGEVWLAERSDGTLQRGVALKLPWRPPAGDPQRLARHFERERDILAALEHPHIARLYDAGVSPEGQPYLALEFVDGQPLTTWCEAQRLTLRERIKLFLQVLQAVQHAHAHLVVHRDLKPSNIFVNREGQVRLLDFGIATLLADDAEPGHGPATEWQHAPMTPDYASPEQISGGPLGTASDIYSLGVVLCELLSGQRPYRLTRPSRGALEEAILHTTPSRPSRLTGPPQAAWQRELRGDLDTIALKALSKRPGDRYASAEAFEQDLRRWLRHEPVLAHPSHWAYRARKFVLRHRLPVAAVGVAMASLATGLGVALQQAEAARRQALRTEAVQDFLIGLFNEADPARAQGRELSAHDLLARGERQMQARLTHEPELAAQLGGVLMSLYRKLGDGVRALPLAEQQVAWARAQQPGGPAHGQALLALARVQTLLGHHEQALATLAQAEPMLAGPSPAVAEARLELTMAQVENLQNLTRNDEAERLVLAALPQLEARYGAQSWPVLQARVEVATLQAARGRTSDSRATLQSLAPLLARDWPAQGLEAAELRADVGYTLWQLRDWEAGAALLRQAIAELDRLAGPRNTSAVKASRTLGMLYLDAGQFSRARQVLSENVARSRQAYGEQDSETALNLSFLVLALNRMGQGLQSEAAAREAWRLVADKPSTLSASEQRGIRRRLGAALLAAGKADAALPVLQALAAEEQAAGTLDHRHAATLSIQAGALLSAGRAREALASAQGSAALFARAASPAAQIGLAKAWLNEALALAALHEPAQARARLAQAEPLLQAVLPPDHPELQLLAWVRAACLQAEGQASAAAAMDGEARRLYTRQSGGTLPPRSTFVF